MNSWSSCSFFQRTSAWVGTVLTLFQGMGEEGKIPVNTRAAMKLLRDQCLSCHNAKKKKGSLVLTNRRSALKGGGEGPALVPSDPENSRLMQLIMPDADPHMPPKKQLSKKQISLLKSWIQTGAHWEESLLATEDKQASPEALGSLPEGYKPVLALALSPDGKRLLSGHGNQLAVHDFRDKSGAKTQVFSPHRDVVQSVAWSNDGKLAASAGYQKVVIWDTSTWSVKLETRGPPGRVGALLFLPGDSILVIASGQPARTGVVQLVSLQTGETIREWEAHGDAIFSTALLPNKKVIITAGADGLVRLWQTSDGKMVFQIEAHSAPVLALAVKADGSLLATGGADRELKVWDLKTAEKKVAVERFPGNVSAIVWPEKGTDLFTASDDGAVRTCKEDSKSPTKTWNKAADLLHCLAAAGDGSILYGGSNDGFVYVWDKTGKITAKLGI